MKRYYELMALTRGGRKSDKEQDRFEDSNEMDKLALEVGIDSESETVSTALGIIRWLLKNDESVKGKYVFKKKK